MLALVCLEDEATRGAGVGDLLELGELLEELGELGVPNDARTRSLLEGEASLMVALDHAADALGAL